MAMHLNSWRVLVLVLAAFQPASSFLPGLSSSLASSRPTHSSILSTLRCASIYIPADRSPAGRRDALHLLGGVGIVAALTAGAGSAAAFDNAIADYAKFANKPKRRGDAPKDLGVAGRTINKDSLDSDPKTFPGLRGCDGKTNCFSTTGDDLLEDRIRKGQDTLIKAWLPPADDATPFKSLVSFVKGYEPGQGFIDGGGFKVVKETDSYLYLQFEALKKGYIDDVEFAISKDRSVQVRSSSRVGATDFGVNAKRLNYIAAGLRSSGWTADDITPKTHADYFFAAADAADQTFDQDRRKGTGFENDRMARPSMGI